MRVGPRMHSDHHPLLISLLPQTQQLGERPFRFEAAWLKHEQFKEFLASKWDGSSSIWTELNTLTPELVAWNKQTFGHIRNKKRELLGRIQGIQRANQQNFNKSLEDLESRLNGELQEILDREEILWFQKARTKWMQDGDRNTNYYHTKTAIRRRINRVSMLKTEENSWVEGEGETGKLVNQFFQHLFTEEDTERDWIETSPYWNKLTCEEWRCLSAPPIAEEIKTAIFNIGGLKSPGCDGYPAIFFHKHWDVVGNSVIQSIQDMWQVLIRSW